eukprot:TRINITY_DN53_c0_g1_i1.p1 TRINITY_DN53_c0_g1~~TRINITY_DN53_c0_g1_i1.p1  ORF type:complete len:593 (+),score=107.96 TRINITY_DN53_c0_g1_i1:394-2172(+)
MPLWTGWWSSKHGSQSGRISQSPRPQSPRIGEITRPQSPRVKLKREVEYPEHQVFLTSAPLYRQICTGALRNAYWHALSDPECQLDEDMKGLRILGRLESCLRTTTAALKDADLKAASKLVSKEAKSDVKAAIEQHGLSLKWPVKKIEELYDEHVGVTANGSPKMLFPEFLELVSENLACIIKCIDLPVFLERSINKREWNKLKYGVIKMAMGATAVACSSALAVLTFVTGVGGVISIASAGSSSFLAVDGAADLMSFAGSSAQGVYYTAVSTEHALDMHEGREILPEERRLALSIFKALRFCNDQLSKRTELGDLNARGGVSLVEELLNRCNRSAGTVYSMADVLRMSLDEWVALDLLKETEYFKLARPEIRKMTSLAIMAGFYLAELHGSKPDRKKTVVVAGFGNAGESTLVQSLTQQPVPQIGDRERTRVPRSYCVQGTNSVRVIDTPAIDDDDDNVASTTIHLIDSKFEVKDLRILFMIAFDRVSNLVNPMAECFNKACSLPRQSGDKLKITVLLHKFQSHKEAKADDAIEFLQATEKAWEEAIKKKIDTDRIELKVLTSDVLEHKALKPELKEYVADLPEIRELITS